MTLLLTFVVFVAVALGSLLLALRGLRHPWEQGSDHARGTAAGAPLGCFVPMLFAVAVGAGFASFLMARDIEPAYWAVAGGMVAPLAGLGWLASRTPWRSARPVIDGVARRLHAGYHPHHLRVDRSTATARVVAAACAVERSETSAPARSYREAPRRPAGYLEDVRRAATSSMLRGVLTALAPSAVAASGAVVLAGSWLAQATLEPLAWTILDAFALLALPATALWVWQLVSLRRARDGIVDVLRRWADRPPEPRDPHRGDAIPADPNGRTLEPGIPVEEAGDPAGGYTGVDVGDGRRFRVDDMALRDREHAERCLWPTGARASTTYGNGYAPATAVGHPRVYPRYGDLKGAWAPKPRRSAAEWIEVTYPEEAPRASAIRVFETNVAGSTYAVTVHEPGDPVERLVFQRPPEPPLDDSRVLEIPLSPPKRVARVRAFLSNEWDGWAQIDTIGLVAADPLPEHLRPAPGPRRPRGLRPALAALVLSVLAVAGVAILLPDATLDEPDTSLEGARATEWDVGPAALESSDVYWASSVVAASSSHSDAQWDERHAAGAPDVWPDHGDVAGAWASASPDDGAEWITLDYPPVRAEAVVVLETHLPGALVRVDDLSGVEGPVTLWRGTMPPADGSRVVRVDLPAPRLISRLRLVLDTSRVEGWNEIDAVGLVPAP